MRLVELLVVVILEFVRFAVSFDPCSSVKDPNP